MKRILRISVTIWALAVCLGWLVASLVIGMGWWAPVSWS